MKPRRDSDPQLQKFARRLRRESTEAERRLWSILRDRRLDGFKFRRQHPMCGFIVDFYCVKAQLAIELDGGQHLDADAQRYDRQRSETLLRSGVKVLRFPDDELLKHPQVVADAIYEALIRTGPHPNPLPDYRERE